MDDILIKAILNVTRGKNIIEAMIINVENAMSDFTVDVQVSDSAAGSSIFFGVPLRVLSGENNQASIIEIPTINSNCLMTFRDGNINRPQLLYIDSVDQYLLNLNKFDITCDNVVFNGGKLGGLIKITDLVTKLNNIEDLLNQFIGIYNSHIHAVTTAPGTTAVPVPLETATLTPTQQSEIEDTTIKH